MAWNTKYNEEDLRLVPSKPILSDFGKALDVEDTVELHIYSRDNETLLFSDTDITSYKVAEGGILDDGTVNQDSVVFLDLHNDIRQFVNSGTFNVKYCLILYKIWPDFLHSILYKIWPDFLHSMYQGRLVCFLLCRVALCQQELCDHLAAG